MSDLTPLTPLTPPWQLPADDAAGLPADLAQLDCTLLADGERWRRSEPSTARLAAHVRALSTATLTAPAPSRPLPPDAAPASRPAFERPSAPLIHPAPHTVRPSWSARWASVAAACLILVIGASFFALFGTHRPSGPAGQRGTTTTGTPASQATGDPTFSPITRETAILPAQTHLDLPPGGYLGAISFSSAHDGWIGGGIRVDDVPGANWSAAKAFLIHYHDGTWATYPQTYPQASIQQIAMISADEGWAIALHNWDPATNTQGTTFLLHYTGGQWHELDDPAFTHVFSETLVMRSPTFGYVTGDTRSQTDPNPAPQVVVLWENGRWHRLQTPFVEDEAQIVMFTPEDGYALSSVGGPAAFYHFSHGTWAQAPDPSVAVTSFTMPSPNNAWAAGTFCTHMETPSPFQKCSLAVSHWNGTSWSSVSPFDMPPTALGAMDMTYSFATVEGQSWLGIMQEDASVQLQRHYTTLLYQYDHGHWQKVSLPLAHVVLNISSWDGNGGIWTLASSENPTISYVLYTQGTDWQIYGQG